MIPVCAHRSREYDSGCQGLRGRRNRELLFNGYKVLVMLDE